MSTNSSPRTRPIRTGYYNKDIEFTELAAHDAEWAAISQQAQKTRWIDFQDPKIVQQLTSSLLRVDFNIHHLSLPDDRLCPAVPVRWNYIRWIQELLDTTNTAAAVTSSATGWNENGEGAGVVGLDVGVGASAIYPLLACASRAGWRMVGTETDARSLKYARQNVEGNGLGGRVRLIERAVAEGRLIPSPGEVGEERLDFTMTNPPFYDVGDEEVKVAKAEGASAVCTGSENEMVCAGGEVGFVERMVEESVVLRGRVRWYTAMLGKLTSLRTVVDRLKREGVGNFAVTCLQAGHRTNRWAVGWSFGDLRPRNDVARHGSLVLAVLPPATAQTVQVPLMSATWAGEKVEAVLGELDVRLVCKEEGVRVMEAKENVWSRAARRKRKFGGGDKEMMDEEMAMDGLADNEKVALGVEIRCRDGVVELRWRQGGEQVLFESFCGMLKRALNTPR